jgi:protein-L-isoaspartate(D-aspartate) O-methyltransferase
VLEVGTGSGYQAAVLAAMGAHVVTIERLPALALRARGVLADLGLTDRVRVLEGDGTLGWAEGAPYDGILVTAGAPALPRPLVAQLALGGALVVPIGDEELQVLVRVRRDADGLHEDDLGECRFVRLRGAWGWKERAS